MMSEKQKSTLTLYICDGCKEICKKDPSNICYRDPKNIDDYMYNSVCYHTSDINHSLVEKAKKKEYQHRYDIQKN